MKTIDVCAIILLIAFPFVLVYVWANFNIPNSAWIAFLGGYVGSIIPMFILYRTRIWNRDDNTQTRNLQIQTIKYQTRRMWFENLRNQLDKNYRVLDFQGCFLALIQISEGKCQDAMSYLVSLTRNIEMQSYNFDLYFQNFDVPAESSYSECYKDILKKYGDYVNDLIIICRMKMTIDQGQDVASYINAYM